MDVTHRIANALGGRAHRLAVAFILASVPMLVLYVALPAGSVAQDVVFAFIGLTACAAIAVGIRRNRPARPVPWVLLGVSQLLFVTGDTLFAILAHLGETPFPSVADLAYLAGYPFLVLAFLQMTWIRVRGGDWNGLLDGAILAGAASVIGWAVLVGPALETADTDPLALAVSAAYPLADLVVVGAAIGLLATPGARTPSFVLLVGSLLLLFAADVGYAFANADGTYQGGGLLDVLWAIAYVATAAAALHRSMRQVAAPYPVDVAWLSRLRLALLALSTVAGPTMILAADVDLGTDLPFIVAASALISVLVVFRLAGVVSALARDNAERRRLEAELSHRATHDALTGLTNRRGFQDSLEAALATGGRFSVLFLDLDDFKTVNDTLGHPAGDALLEAVAGRIRHEVRAGDVVARLGGDEFAVLAARLDADAAGEIAERIIRAVEEPFHVAGTTVTVGASVGVVDPSRASRDASELMRAADVAMYGAKALGKGRAQLYDAATVPVAVAPGRGRHREAASPASAAGTATAADTATTTPAAPSVCARPAAAAGAAGPA
jgi:diguanylate cyclase